MNEHVSSEWIEQALAGNAEPRGLAHMESCAACAEEFVTMQRLLGGFRGSAVLFAEREQRLAAKPVARAANRRWQGWAVAACAATVLAVGVPVERHRHAAPAIETATTTRPAQSTEASISDEALLNDVASDLSTSVPQPLAPLTVASSTATTGSTSSSKSSD